LSLGEHSKILYFSTINFGWVGGDENSFYKTTDGGKTWIQKRIELPASTHIADIYFVNEALGWAVLQHYNSDFFNYQDMKAWLLVTNDGGQHWQTQYQGNALNIKKVSFINEMEGWAVGGKEIKKETVQTDLLVLHTTDGGAHWSDVSDPLNKVIADCQNRVQDSVSDSVALGPGKILLMTSDGYLLKTEDHGRSWQKISDLKSDVGLGRMTFTPSNRLRIVGGLDGVHGFKGALAQNNSDGSWTRYVLDNIDFGDAVNLSEDQVLACGTLLSQLPSRSSEGKREGVILYSSNGGRNWTIVYRNANVRRIYSLAIIDADHIWAIGENGLLLRLKPSQ